jgi:CubicO group peptidase (beta-lactamase class C family)
MESDESDTPRRVPRRSVLTGLTAAGVAGGIAVAAGGERASATAARPATSESASSWKAFDKAVASAFERMHMVGGAVAVVSGEKVLHTRALGVRRVHRSAPVTDNTHFLVASTTKSMSSLLVATYIDEGKLDWDQPVIDAWSAFRAPTEQLTRTLRVRDLLGMASGIGEPPALSGLHEGDPSASQLLQSVVNLPVIAEPGKQFFYNNTVYAVGGYLPFLAAGVAESDLPAAYGEAMKKRIFEPAGMKAAHIADDPRGVVSDYAAGNGPDLRGKMTTLPYGPVGSYAPVGGTLASLNDMAAYVRLQLRKGVSGGGNRVVSAESLAECWKAHISVPTSAEYNPDAASAGYGMGWSQEKFTDGTTLISHTGGIDGFTSYIGFLPERDLGLVVLASMNPGPTGLLFYPYVLNLLLSERLGLNTGVADKYLALYRSTLNTFTASGAKARQVSEDAVAPYLGYYEGGYSLTRSGRNLRLKLGPRVFPLLVQPDKSYIIAGGLLVGTAVKLARDTDGIAHIELVGYETVRRTVGLD